MTQPSHDWDWSKFKGDPACLKWSRRDLETLDEVLALVSERVAVIQAGGNVGIFPKRLAQHFRTVYTFEPHPKIFASLVQNVPELNVLKYQAALGAERGPIGLSNKRRDGSNKPRHDGLTHVAGEGEIPTLLIDDLALPICNLIYLDVEGFELFALHGAEKTIRRCRPVIAVEINEGIKHYGLHPDELRHFLHSHGYYFAFQKHSDEIYIPG